MVRSGTLHHCGGSVLSLILISTIFLFPANPSWQIFPTFLASVCFLLDVLSVSQTNKEDGVAKCRRPVTGVTVSFSHHTGVTVVATEVYLSSESSPLSAGCS